MRNCTTIGAIVSGTSSSQRKSVAKSKSGEQVAQVVVRGKAWQKVKAANKKEKGKPGYGGLRRLGHSGEN
jgi:hypothetical protein